MPTAAGLAALEEPPPGAQRPARSHPPRFIHSAPGAAAPPALLPGRKAGSGTEGQCWVTAPAQGPGHAAPAAFARGWSIYEPARPAPKTRSPAAPQPRRPSLRRGAGEASSARWASARKPQVPAARLPRRGRKSPQRPLPRARLPSPRRPDPLRTAPGLLLSAGGGPQEAKDDAAHPAGRTRASLF